ncbi:ADP-ribosyl cyclase/cyclic ADP-ribose hydrolase 1-like isoform 2-T2 [Aulostomus maculatus]
MEPEKKRRRRRCLFLGVVAVLLVILIIAVGVGVRLSLRHKTLQATFTERCEKFKGYDCKMLWSVFEQAYVGRDPCDVPMTAYDPLLAAAPFKPECNRMMFWSKTKDVVHALTEKSGCFLTLEDTLLGSVTNGLSWCGKEHSNETFTTDCPGWSDCQNNPVRSFWSRASAAFADAACGNVSVMLNGSIPSPFSSQSIFGSIEVKRFNPSKMGRLNVVLVTQKNSVSNCENVSLKQLQKELGDGIKYSCQEVAE